MSELERSGPWRGPDTLGKLTVDVIAVAGVLVAWIAVSGQERFIPQLEWLTVGVAALVVAGIADALWLLTGMHAIRDRRRALLRAGWQVAVTTTPLNALVSTDYVVVPRTDLYHLRTCPFVEGKPARSFDPTADRRRHPCPMCLR